MEKQIMERIQLYLRKERMKPAEFAKILGINSTSVYNYFSGTSKAPMSFIALFLESFPDISAEWLLRGEGEMTKPVKKNHYLEMAERVNGTYMASEEGEHNIYKSIMDTLITMNEKITKLENQLKA